VECRERAAIAARAGSVALALAVALLAAPAQQGISIVDTRSPQEYAGVGGKEWQQSTGHIEGARRIDSEEFFADDSEFTIRETAVLQLLMRQRANPGDTVIFYCMVGYRSSTGFFVARLLGYQAMLYDGSYEDWFSAHYPTVTWPTPLIVP